MHLSAINDTFNETDHKAATVAGSQAGPLVGDSSPMKGSRLYSAKRSTTKSNHSFVTLTAKDKSRTTTKRQESRTLGIPNIATTEIAIQTDITTDNQYRGPTAKQVRMIDNGSETQLIDPDSYKEDWAQSFVYKKAMKTEAIRRGEPYDSDYSVNEEDEKIEMTAHESQSQVEIHADLPNADQTPDTEEEVQYANA